MNHGKAYFAVKRKHVDPTQPLVKPVIIAFVRSWEEAIKVAENRNHYTDGDPFYADVVHT